MEQEDERRCDDATEADFVDLNKLSPAEEAVAVTLRGWGDGLDPGEKLWLMNWNFMIRDVVVAMRTGEPVLYDDDED